jgi:hypothetical protein
VKNDPFFIYKTEIETPFICASKDYFKVESKRLMDGMSCIEYIMKVNSRLE